MIRRRFFSTVSSLCILPCLLTGVLVVPSAVAQEAQPASGAAAPDASKPRRPALRPITHEDVWLAKRLGDPATSPDGKWAVFAMTQPAYDEKEQVSDLWIVPTDGSAPARRITFSKSAESGVTWSDDSRRLAFSAKRDGDDVAQIYVLDVLGGGEAVRVTQLTNGARRPQFAPDGHAIVFTSNVFPGALTEADNKRIADERKARKYNARVFDGFPIRHWDKWLDDVQSHLFVLQIDSPAVQSVPPRDLFAGTQLVARKGFGGRRSEGGEETLDAAWAPDGTSIVFTATTNRDTAAYAFTNTGLFRVPVQGGEPELLTAFKDAKSAVSADSFEQAQFSPDGKSLFALYEKTTDRTYNLTRLVSMPWPAVDSMRVVTARLDRVVSEFAFSADGATVYVSGEDAGHEKIWSLPREGGEPKLVVDPPVGVYTGLSGAEHPAATTLVARFESSINPPEIVRIDLERGAHTVLTDFNSERAAQIDWKSPEHFWFTSKRGRHIHNMVILPPAFDAKKKYPLFVLIHGGPANMWRDQFFLRWNYHLLAQPGYVLLLTNYSGSTGFGEKFAQNIQGDPLQTPGDEVNQAADEAIKRYAFIDANRQCAGGASYGGHLANWMQATTTRYRCLISHAGLINLESQWGTSDTIYSREVNQGGPVWEQGSVWRKQNPIRYAARFRTPILITVGEQDFRVPLNNSLENWSVLQRLRIPSRLIVFPEENHWVLKGEDSRFFYSEVKAWLARWLQPDGAAAAAAD